MEYAIQRREDSTSRRSCAPRSRAILRSCIASVSITAREAQAWTPYDVYLRALLELYGNELELLGADEDGDEPRGRPRLESDCRSIVERGCFEAHPT